MPELRKDPILGHWVIISTDRARRPVEYRAEAPPARSAAFCPFCPGAESKTPPEILSFRDGSSWTLRVVPNKFPALKIEGALDRDGEGLYDKMSGIGAHEVIIETPRHDAELGDLSEREVQLVLRAYRDRISDLKGDRRFRYVMVFKNEGAAAGASLEHSHSQLIALPVVPTAVVEEMRGAKAYFDYRERCIYCDIVRQEQRDGRRVILENEHFIVVAPWAPRVPFETWILPKVHHAAFEMQRPEDLAALASALRGTLKRLSTALDQPPYNFMLHTAPFHESECPHYHWHLEIVPTLTKVAGFEWGSGFYINPTPPEDAAAFLRELDIP